MEASGNEQQKNKRKGKSVLVGIAMLYCVFSIGQILNACRFSFFTLDDYWNTVWALEGQGGTQNSLWAHFADSFSFTRQMFLGWQGTWLAAFFQAFLNPLLLLKVGPGQERLLHLILASVVLLFFLSIFLVLYEIIRLLYGKSLALSMIIYAILLFSLLNFGVYKENFYWFTGVGGYSVPFCCGMFGIYVLLLPAGRNYAGGRRGACYVLSAILLFCATGGSLQVTGIICGGLMTLTVMAVKEKRYRFPALSSFSIALIGALLNTAAPGNYVRAKVISQSGLNLPEAVRNTLYSSLYEMEELWQSTPFVGAFLVIMGVGIQMAERVTRQTRERIVLMIVCSFCMIFIAIFPVVLAYRDSNLADRNQLYAYFCMIMALLLTGGYIGIRVQPFFHLGQWQVVLSIAMLCVICAGRFSVFHAPDRVQMMQMKRLEDYTSGDISMYYTKVERVIDKLRNGDGLSITRKDIPETAPDTTMAFTLMDNNGEKVYDFMSSYYGYQSLPLR